jgi:hypothetical protein
VDDEALRRSGATPSRAPDRSRRDHVYGLPDSARLALWLSAWFAGNVSLDDARDGVIGADAAHDVLISKSSTAETDLVPLILAMGILRSAGARSAGLALPVPGDPLGLGGPVAFNAEALEAGQAVVVDGADLGLVPMRTGAGVVWKAMPAEGIRQAPDLDEADTELRRALPQVADDLADLDVARWRPEVADELMNLRRPLALDVPPGTTGRAQRMLALGTRCRLIVAMALEDDGGALTAAEADRRRSALRPLERAARRAVVAACSAPVGS